jgi:hypothetical protein
MQTQLKTTLDHVIIGSYALDAGVHFVYEKLGVRTEHGGQHLTMGTHNQLLKLGNLIYLEVIAIDPSLPKPQRPRWFSMDKFGPTDKSRLLTWVVRTNDIEQAVRKSPFHHGKIQTLQRGIYQWQIAIPEDGQMPLGGIAPMIIQWHSEAHPAQILSPSDVTLSNIAAFHPKADELKTFLREIGFTGNFTATTTESHEEQNLQVTLQAAQKAVVFSTSI